MTPPIVRIKVDRYGGVFIDAAPVKLPALRKRLRALRKKNATVWYYREGPRVDAPPAAFAVMDAIMAAGLAVDLFEDAASFSNPPSRKELWEPEPDVFF